MSTDQQPSVVEAIARSRQSLLVRANELLGADHPVPLTERTEALPEVTRLFALSLAELKVAEEELRTLKEREAARREEEARVTDYYRGLFRHLPMAAMVTDMRATILETNTAMAELFGRRANELEEKGFASLLDPSFREEFRNQLARVSGAEGRIRWRLVMNRLGDVPVNLGALVSRISQLGPNGADVLLWLFDAPAGAT